MSKNDWIVGDPKLAKQYEEIEKKMKKDDLVRTLINAGRLEIIRPEDKSSKEYKEKETMKAPIFSTKAAAQYLGVHPNTLRKYSDLGLITARKLQRRRVFTLEDLDVFIESLPPYSDYGTNDTVEDPMSEMLSEEVLDAIVARIEELEKKLDKFLAAFGIERVCVWDEFDALKIQMDKLRSKLEHPNRLDLSINGSDQKGEKNHE
jgi:DNA-binding transcriptional MerR regulator